MKQTNLSKLITFRILSVLLLFLGFHNNVIAQALSCNNHINFSVDATCSGVITPDMILEGGPYNYAQFTVSINGGGSIINPSMIGLTLPVTVTHTSGNSCWGNITIEDKIDPVITCTDVTINCDDPLPPAPTATDACGPATVSMVSQVIVNNGCTGLYSETITRVWEASDPSGNTATCTQVISRLRSTLANVLFPANVTIDCTADPNATNPTTGLYLTGAPANTGCSNIIITSNDVTVPICSGSYKVLRTWTAVDWCAPSNNNTMSILQVINVMDSTPPVVTNPGTLNVSTTASSCAGNVFLPSLVVTDDCSTIGATTFSINGTAIPNGILSNAPLGTSTIDYSVADECGNVATGSFELSIVDNISPIAICDEITTVGIGNTGLASVPAIVFDDGSYDNCGIVSMDVRRMTDACNTPPNLGWGPFANFCCADVGSTVMVEFRIQDAAGNVNSCMVDVIVEDNTPPTIICPNDKTINCDDDYTDTNLTGMAVASSSCGNPTPTYVDNVAINNCGEGLVTRIWSVGSGSNSASCVQFITLINTDPFYINPTWTEDPNDDVVWPPDYTTTFCGANLDPTALPTPYNEPVIIAPDCGDIAVGHSDLELPIQAPGCIKILRTWTVIDWCQYDVSNPSAGGSWTYVQILKVMNNSAPIVNCGNSDSYVENFDPACGAAYVNLFTDANDDCTAQNDLLISFVVENSSNVVIMTGTGNNASDAFNNGDYKITWTVEDGCGNTQICVHTFTVVDAKKPTPVCLNGLSSVVMPSSGSVTLPATAFESGSSYDNCTAYNNLIFSFSSDVTELTRTFTCADVINGQVSVQIWVTDGYGNQDFCTTYIDIQDPNGVCGPTPSPLTVNCGGDTNVQNLDPNCGAMSVNLFVNVSGGCNQGSNVSINYAVQNSGGSTVATGSGSTVSQSFNNGSYTITWTVDDGCGNVQTCTHSFTIVDGLAPTPVCPNNPTVTLPSGGTTELWASDFDSGAYDNCTPSSGLIFSFSSDVTNTNRFFDCNDFLNNNPVTLQIWVTDAAGNQAFCTVSIQVLDPTNACSGGGGSSPITADCSGSDSNVQNTSPNCDPAYVNLFISTSGGCTQGNVSINYVVKDNNGTIVTSGSGSTASQNFSNGSYTVTWTVDDGCGNVVTCDHSFTVVDGLAPTPVCPNNPIVTLPSGGSTELWASDFNSGAYDNCTPSSGLVFSFSSDVTNTNRYFNCDDFLNNNPVALQIWVTDAAGNQAFCNVSITVEDPTGACNSGPGPLLSIEPAGLIQTEEELEVENVTVNLDGSTMPSIITNSTGSYSFGTMNAPGTGVTYTARPVKDMNPINGVTTFDLVLISKHILGNEPLSSPYKEIAADANNSETITTFDIVVLRRLILQIDTEFQGTQTSWRFVDAYHTFPNGTFPFPEVMNASNMQGGVDFVAVKIGDVNGSASPNQLLGTDTRTFAGDLVFKLEDQQIAAGEEFTVDFKAQDFNQTLGYQFSLGFDNTKVSFVDVATHMTNLDESNFGFALLEEGVITTSWNHHEAVTLENDEKIFSLTFTANEALNISEILKINSRYTPAEAYDNNDIYDVALAFGNEIVSNQFEVYQNTPNPFKATTTISFNLPEAVPTSLKIFDVAGQLLKSMELEGTKGYNSVEINRSEFSATGVLYYQVETANHTATMKMIVVD